MRRSRSHRVRDFVVEKVLAANFALLWLVSFTIIVAVFYHGRSRLGLDFLLSPSSGGGYSGGIRYQLIGTLILIATAALAVTPFAVSIALVHTQFASSRLRRAIDITLQLLNATPSILFGILGFIFFFKLLGWEKSWLAGGLVLATMILPMVVVSLIQRIQTIPSDYVEVSRGLGFSEDQLIWRVILPYGWGGLLTGIVLGISRAAGETAPILFTAAVMAGADLPRGIKDSPVLALPYHIFNLTQDVFGKGAMENAWSSAAVLLAVCLGFSLLVVPLRARSHEEAKS